ncbi:hypothetical protein [Flindersiella endophytica]
MKQMMLGKPRSKRQPYEYTISRWKENDWREGPPERILSNQRARVLARQLLERWVNDHVRDLPGGRIVDGEKGGGLPKGVLEPNVRVRVYQTMEAAYLVHLRKDYQ